MFFTQLQTLLYLLDLLVDKPIISFLDVVINHLMVRNMTEIKKRMHKLFVLEISQVRLYHRPLPEHLLQLLQFLLLNSFEPFTKKIFLRISRPTRDRLDDLDLVIVKRQQHNQLPSYLKSNIVYLKNKLTIFLLNMQSSDNLPQKQLRIENLLVLKLLVSNTLNSTIPSHQLTFTLNLTLEVFDVLTQQQIARSRLPVTKIYALPDLPQSLEKTVSTLVRPIFSISRTTVNL